MNVTSTKPTSFLIEVVDTQESFTGYSDVSLLQSLEIQRCKTVRIGCRSGGCGVCKVSVLEGEFVSKKMSTKHIGNDALNKGMVLSCRVYPRSDLKIKTRIGNPENL